MVISRVNLVELQCISHYYNIFENKYHFITGTIHCIYLIFVFTLCFLNHSSDVITAS